MRYLTQDIGRDLSRKMVFLSGPRQVGKTWLARQLAARRNRPMSRFHEGQDYLLWDDDDDRRRILDKSWPRELPLIVLDEIHKFGRWKNWIKGVWDKRAPSQTFLLTGSARLDIFKRGGDSLLGRYHHWRLHPFCLRERPESVSPAECFDRLMNLGGFPEPFLSGNETEAKRWRKERADLLVREDLRDLERVREVGQVGLLVDLLKRRATMELVFDHLRQDLQVSLDSVKRWVDILARLYICFVVRPYAVRLSRAISRPPKVYFYDNADVPVLPEWGLGPRFENLVATHLLKQLNYLEDRDGDRWELHFLRDKEKREVDFVITKNQVVDELIEVKWRAQPPGSALLYYRAKLEPRRTTLIYAEGGVSREERGVRVVHVADAFERGRWERD